MEKQKQKKLLEELETAVKDGLGPLAEAIAEETSSPEDKLVSSKARAEKLEAEIRENLDAFTKKCRDGFIACVKEVQALGAHDPEIDVQGLRDDLQQAFDQLDSLETVENFGMQVLEGESWSDLLHFKESTLQLLYKGAKHLFDEKRYEEAEQAFSFLITLDAKQYPFWLGLGHAAFHLKNWDLATNAYAMASINDPTSVWPHIYAANCFEAQNNFHHALMALEEALEVYKKGGAENKELEEAISRRIAEAKNKA